MIRQNLHSKEKFKVQDYKPIYHFLEFSQITEEHLKKIMYFMQTKSCESDVIQTNFLKHHLHEFAVILMKIINKSLELGIFVEDWKVAIIRPLVKKRDAEYFDNSLFGETKQLQEIRDNLLQPPYCGHFIRS